MRLIVTGAAGFVGSHVVRQAAAAGHEVMALLRPRADAADRAAATTGAEARTLDLHDGAALTALIRDRAPVAVVHLAWYARPPDYLSSEENLESMDATIALARAVLTDGCACFVGIGTCLEYAATTSLHRESDAVDPRSLYAATKLATWHVVRALGASRQVPVAWARLFHMHGPGEHPGRLVPRVRASLRAGTPVDLTAGAQVRDHLHVTDVASGLLRLVEAGAQGVVNVCSGQPVTLRDVLTALADVEGGRDLLRFGSLGYRADEVMYLAGDCERLRSLGWRPRFSELRASFADGGEGGA